MFNLDFSLLGKTGAVSVNQNGDRNSDYDIYHFHDNTFQHVARYDSFNMMYKPRVNVSSSVKNKQGNFCTLLAT